MKILVALPVYNEELVVEKNSIIVLNYLQKNFPTDEVMVVIADNNSTDRTGEISKQLASEQSGIKYLFITQKGKGNAWRTAMLQSEADVYLFMDVDLAVELTAVRPLVENIVSGYDLAIGSRYLPDSKVERSWSRGVISATYRFLAGTLLGVKVSDFTCGFKAISHEVREKVLSLTQDNMFFLDTELIALVKKQGYKIKEVPVNWSEFRDLERKSTVNIFRTTNEYLVKIFKLRKRIKSL